MRLSIPENFLFLNHLISQKTITKLFDLFFKSTLTKPKITRLTLLPEINFLWILLLWNTFIYRFCKIQFIMNEILYLNLNVLSILLGKITTI